MAERGKGVLRVIDPVSKSLGEFTVRRALPDAGQQRIGPFIFFDHMGPADFEPGTGVNVRPHPHIGLATITWLFAGEIRHRDSLGYDQIIRPGAVNWMTAGRGVVHSERTPDELKASGSHLHGIQAWIALPLDSEEMDPCFVHYDADDIPEIELPDSRLRIIAGCAFGKESPVRLASETLYIEADLEPGARLDLPQGVEELGLYVVEGSIGTGGGEIRQGRLAVLSPRNAISIRSANRSKCMLLGGSKLAGDRIIWWNFVSSSRERIERAKKDWREGRFEAVPGDSEFIPLPRS